MKFEEFIKFLKCNSNNTKIMADFRRIPRSEFDALHHINRFCNITDNKQRIITLTIGKIFSIIDHDCPNYGNFGATMREINKNHSTVENKFRRMYDCKNEIETLCRYVLIIVKMGGKNTIVNLERLYRDLYFWDFEDDIDNNKLSCRLWWTKSFYKG